MGGKPCPFFTPTQDLLVHVRSQVNLSRPTSIRGQEHPDVHRDNAKKERTAIILDPSVQGNENGSSSNASEHTWTVTFPNYTISGIASCNEIIGNDSSRVYSGNQNDIKQGTQGRYCWCRMTNPVRSAWIYNSARDSTDTCVERCASSCGANVRTNADYRRAMYAAAGQ